MRDQSYILWKYDLHMMWQYRVRFCLAAFLLIAAMVFFFQTSEYHLERLRWYGLRAGTDKPGAYAFFPQDANNRDRLQNVVADLEFLSRRLPLRIGFSSSEINDSDISLLNRAGGDCDLIFDNTLIDDTRLEKLQKIRRLSSISVKNTRVTENALRKFYDARDWTIPDDFPSLLKESRTQ